MKKSWQILRKDSSPISIHPFSFSPGLCFVPLILRLQKAKQTLRTTECNATKFQISSKGGRLIVKFRFRAHLANIYTIIQYIYNYVIHTMTSSNVWIQPWSLSILLRECKCRIIPAAKPGTPATVSRKMHLVNTDLSSRVPRAIWSL